MWGEIDTTNDVRAREIRKCAKCGAGSLIVYHVTQHYSRGLPTGRSYMHRCEGCQATIESISLWRTIMLIIGGGFAVTGGFVMTTSTLVDVYQWGPPIMLERGNLWRAGFGLLLLLGGLAWCGWTTWKAANLMLNHPVVGNR